MKAPGNWTPTRYSGSLALGAIRGYAKTGIGWSMVIQVANHGDVIHEGLVCKPGVRRERSEFGLTWKFTTYHVDNGQWVETVVSSGVVRNDLVGAKALADAAWVEFACRAAEAIGAFVHVA